MGGLPLAAVCCLLLAGNVASQAYGNVKTHPAPASAGPSSRRLLGDRLGSLQERMVESADGEGGSMADWEVECETGRLRCPSLFLASWGYQCVTWDGRACCRKPDGRSCRSLEHWEHAEHPEGWQGTDADSSQPGADAAVDPKAAEKVEVKAGGRAGSRLRALSTEDAPAGSHASSSNTEPTADSDSASTDAGSAADDGEPESQDSDSDCSSGTSSDAADAEDVEEEQEQDDGPTSYNEAKWGKGDGKDGKGSERSTSDDYGDGKDGGVSAERREEEGEGRARRHSRKERGGRRRDDDDDSGSGRKRGKRSSGSGWRRAAATHYTSYPPCCHDRSVDQSECADYSGCKWEGMFKGLSGKQPKSWVEDNNIVAVYESPNHRNREEWDRKWKNKRLRLKHPDTGKELEVRVVDTCDDDDCDGCCTANAAGAGGLLIDLEWNTAERFWGKGDVRGVSKLEFQVLED